MKFIYLLLFLIVFNFLFSESLKVKAGDLKTSGFLAYSSSNSLNIETISSSSIIYEDKFIKDNFNIAIYNKDIHFLINKKDSTISFQNEFSVLDNNKILFRLNNSFSDGEIPIINHSLFLSIPSIVTPGIILSKSFSPTLKTGSKYLLFFHYPSKIYESVLFLEYVDSFTTPLNESPDNSINFKSINNLVFRYIDIKFDYENQYKKTESENVVNLKLKYKLNKLFPYTDIKYQSIYGIEDQNMITAKAGITTKGVKLNNELYWAIRYINYPIHYGKASSAYNINNWEFKTELHWEYILNLNYTPKIRVKYDYKKIKGGLEFSYFPEKLKKWELIVDIYSLL